MKPPSLEKLTPHSRIPLLEKELTSLTKGKPSQETLNKAKAILVELQTILKDMRDKEGEISEKDIQELESKLKKGNIGKIYELETKDGKKKKLRVTSINECNTLEKAKALFNKAITEYGQRNSQSLTPKIYPEIDKFEFKETREARDVIAIEFNPKILQNSELILEKVKGLEQELGYELEPLDNATFAKTIINNPELLEANYDNTANPIYYTTLNSSSQVPVFGRVGSGRDWGFGNFDGRRADGCRFFFARKLKTSYLHT